MRRIAGIMEGLILVAIGAYAGLLVVYGGYWRYLNPKFKPLTGVTAVLLIVVGVVATCKPNKQPGLFRIGVFLLLLRALFLANGGWPASQHAYLAADGGGAVEVQPRVTVNGIEYVRINLAELYLLSTEPEAGEVVGPFAVRGVVKRSEQLDRAGQFALLRTTVFCCLADAVAMGFLVRYERPEEFTDGQWVEVYGTLEALSEETPAPVLQMRETRISVVSDSHVLAPTAVSPIEEPDIPYIFEFRQSEPYAY